MSAGRVLEIMGELIRPGGPSARSLSVPLRSLLRFLHVTGRVPRPLAGGEAMASYLKARPRDLPGRAVFWTVRTPRQPRAVSSLSRRVSPCRAVDRRLAASTDIWRTASVL